jgi:hypothetical protein
MFSLSIEYSSVFDVNDSKMKILRHLFENCNDIRKLGKNYIKSGIDKILKQNLSEIQ